MVRPSIPLALSLRTVTSSTTGCFGSSFSGWLSEVLAMSTPLMVPLIDTPLSADATATLASKSVASSAAAQNVWLLLVLTVRLSCTDALEVARHLPAEQEPADQHEEEEHGERSRRRCQLGRLHHVEVGD